MNRKPWMLVSAILFFSACDSGIKTSQQIAERFFFDLSKGGKNAVAYFEHFNFLAKPSLASKPLCKVEDYKEFQARWTRLKINRVDIGEVKMLDNIGLQNEVEVVAHTETSTTYSAKIIFDVKINEFGAGPRGWIVTMTALPSVSDTKSNNIGKAICESGSF